MIPNIPKAPPNQPANFYTIRVKGCLPAPEWAEWFGGMILEIDETRGETCLRGPIADQAELYGLLARLRNLRLTLLSVECVLKQNP